MTQKNRVTQEDVDAAITKVEYTVLPDQRTTICLLTLDNGYTVRGESSCVAVENFDKALGEEYALKDAKSKVWPLLVFRLADELKYGKRVSQHTVTLSCTGVLAGIYSVKTEPTVKEKLQGEAGDLATKLRALDQFITGNTSFHGLPRIQQELLIKQREYMRDYLSVLSARKHLMD